MKKRQPQKPLLTRAQITELETLWEREIGEGKSPWDAAMTLVEHVLKEHKP
jgi:hypothetical protein